MVAEVAEPTGYALGIPHSRETEFGDLADRTNSAVGFSVWRHEGYLVVQVDS